VRRKSTAFTTHNWSLSLSPDGWSLLFPTYHLRHTTYSIRSFLHFRPISRPRRADFEPPSRAGLQAFPCDNSHRLPQHALCVKSKVRSAIRR
jgi:hypothetical protein